jgi:tetratricopeptide (TPR) repeat protein
MMMVSLCLSAQNIDDFISEKTKDVAYSASNTMLINKKWYMFDKDFDIYTTYYIFRADKTGEIVKPKNYSNCSYEEVASFTWSRDHNNLTIKLNVKNASSFRKLVYKDPSASERKKAELKRIIQDEINETNNSIRALDYDIYKYYINRLDAKLFLLEGIERAYAGLGQSHKESWDNTYFCTEAGEKEIKEIKKKEEEAKKREAEEEAKKKAEEAAVKEADNLNEKAYEYAENDNFGEAIATIDKAINLCPNNPDYYDSKGEILYNMGDKDGAKGMWDKVVSLDPKYSEKNTILYKFLFNPEIFNESEADLNSFEEIANRLIRKKNGENVTITNEDYEKFQNLVDKLNKSPYTFKQKKRIREIAKKLQ